MGDLLDFQRFSDELENELSKLDRHYDADIPHVKRFVQKLDGDVTDGTLAEYLKNLRKTSERLDHPITSLSEADMDAHVYDIRHSPEYGHGAEDGLSNGTVRNIEFAVRRFLKVVDVDGVEWAEDYELSDPVDNKVQPEDILVDEDIAALRDGANNLRDVAIIEFLADSGARLSLVGSLRVRDLDLDKDRPTYTPNPNAAGLKGAAIREYPIIDSKSTLRTYLRTTHPRPDDPDVAFFHTIPGHGNDWEDGDGALTPTTIRRQLRRAADNGGVDKPVNPHNFRHSAITRMRREGYDRAEVEHRVHWTVDTDMWEVYEHISGEQHNEAIWQAAGMADEEEGPDASRSRCPNCTELIAPHHDYCPQCGDEVSKAARDLKQSATSSLADGMVAVDDMSRQEFLAFVLQRIEEEPDRLGSIETPD